MFPFIERHVQQIACCPDSSRTIAEDSLKFLGRIWSRNDLSFTGFRFESDESRRSRCEQITVAICDRVEDPGRRRSFGRCEQPKIVAFLRFRQAKQIAKLSIEEH